MSVSRDAVVAFLEELTDGAIVYDGFEDAFIGFAERCSSPGVAIYSYERMIQVLMGRDGMTYDEAVEYIDFNVIGGWVGERTPYVMTGFNNFGLGVLG
jgi:hypothetical protein